MSETIEWVDVTDRAKAGGWGLPDGWTVRAEISPDNDSHPDHFDCYDAVQVQAWRDDAWRFVVLSVHVEDADGRQWGASVVGANEYGRFPLVQEEGDYQDAYPNPFGELAESDMINEALKDAVESTERFCDAEKITEPTGVNYSGL